MEICQRELQSDGTLSERTLDAAAGLLARSPLLALCSDEVSLHREGSFTTATLAPLYPESGLLLESAGADFTGAGSTTSILRSSAAAAGVALSAGTGSDTGGAVTGTDGGTHGSLVGAWSRWLRFRSASRRPDRSLAMQCFRRCRLVRLETVDSVSSERER